MNLLKIILFLCLTSTLYANNKHCSCLKTPPRFTMHPAAITETQPNHNGMMKIPAGTLLMGGDNYQARPDELPKHKVEIKAFLLDKTLVTNQQFQQFINATHYTTTAEIKPDWEVLKKQLPSNTPKPDEKLLVPSSLVFTPADHAVPLDNPAQWWAWKAGADWRHPHGPESKIAGWNHPVVQVSYDDANAYCTWAGKRLATEAEFEWAARGGLQNKIFAWGNEPLNQGKPKANTWEGKFPFQNSLHDKYYFTSPVATYPANGYGLYDMAGNVWEWVADWYRADYYKMATNVKGPANSLDPDEPKMPKRVLRGGSYLCNESYCSGYRVSARMKSTPDTSMEHIGFRCAG